MMLNELECVWTALFGECARAVLRHNEHILNSSIAAEFGSNEGGTHTTRIEDAKLYSLKGVLQAVIDNGETELTDLALEAVFRVREDLVNVFRAVAQDQGFEKLHSDALKLIIIDALNRKVKELNPEFTASTTDVTDVKAVNPYFDRITQLKQLCQEIGNVDASIRDAKAKIEKSNDTLQTVEEYIQALERLQ